MGRTSVIVRGLFVSAVTNRAYPALSHHHTPSFLNLPLHIQVVTKLGFVAFLASPSLVERASHSLRIEAQ